MCYDPDVSSPGGRQFFHLCTEGRRHSYKVRDKGGSQSLQRSHWCLDEESGRVLSCILPEHREPVLKGEPRPVLSFSWSDLRDGRTKSRVN